jgi:hypothetical protein
MKLSHKIAITTVLLSCGVQVQADSNSAMQGVSTTRKTATSADSPPSGAVTPGTAPSDNELQQVSTTRENTNTDGSGGAASPPKGSDGTTPVFGQPVTFTAIVTGAGAVTDKVTNDREKTMDPKGNSPVGAASAKISDNNSPLPTDRPASKEASKPGSAASLDRWGSYSTNNVASPRKDAERDPAQASAAVREKYNAQAEAGIATTPTPLMNGPNAGLPNIAIPAAQSPLTPGPLTGAPGVMGHQ